MTNNIIKKTLSAFISILLLMSISGGSVFASESNTCTNNTSNIIMTRGYSCTLPNSVGGDNSTCSSSNPNVAKILPSGKIVAVGSGTCTITVAGLADGIKRECKLTVQPVSMSVSAKSVSLDEGTAKAVKITTKNSKSIKATSSDTSVATVSFGKWSKNQIKLNIKGLKAGTAEIKVYFSKNKTIYKTIAVTVSEKTSDTITQTTVTDKQTTVVPKQTTAAPKQTTAAPKQTTVTSSKPAASNDAVTQVFNIVNEQRAANGLSSLKLDPTLCEMADVRVSEINTSFSHTRPDGTSCFTIFDQFNYSYSSVRENIAKGQPTAERVMSDWMNSPGHKANILASDVTKIGIGYDSSTNAWVQLFAG